MSLRFGNTGTPLILQAEMSECALACVAMVAGRYGKRFDLNTLRRKFPGSQRGSNLAQLSNIADQMQLGSRSLRLSLEELDQLKRPCVLHWNLNHFVVLVAVKRNKIIILDPAAGQRQILLSEVSNRFSGVAIEFWPEAGFVPEKKAQRLKISHFLQHTTGLVGGLISLLALSLVLQAVVLLSPMYLQWVVDEALVQGDADLVWVLAYGFALLVIIKVAVDWFRSWLLLHIGNQMALQLSSGMLRHLLRLPLSWFESRHMGDIVSRFGSLNPIRELLTQGAAMVLVDGLMATGTAVMMFIYSPVLAWFALVAVGLYALVQLVVYPVFRARTMLHIGAKAKEESQFMESVRAILSIKASGRESTRLSAWQVRQVDALNAGIDVQRLGINIQSVNGAVIGLGGVGIIYAGAHQVLAGVFSVGMLFAFISYQRQFTERLSGLIERLMEIRALSIHLERLADIAFAVPEAQSRTTVAPPHTSLHCERMSFRYSPYSPWVFVELDLAIRDGEFVAFVGLSGGGKTTLLKVLMGLLPVTSGRVCIGGVDISQLGLQNYRALIGAVMQEDQLLTGSIVENIAFFSDEVSHAHVLARAQAVATRAGIHQDIVAMPMGYETLIGDMGSTLSGGQRQRLLLARALYRKPKILVLDEGTANLDPGNAALVASLLTQLPMTRIIATHDMKLARQADSVYALVEGRLELQELKA